MQGPHSSCADVTSDRQRVAVRTHLNADCALKLNLINEVRFKLRVAVQMNGTDLTKWQRMIFRKKMN